MTVEATKLIIECDECAMIDEDCQGIVANPDKFSIEKIDDTLRLLAQSPHDILKINWH